MIYIGADHAGFELKEKIKNILTELGYKYMDMGNKKFESDDDYPDYAYNVARKVADTKGRGILVCGSGVGVCIVANKIRRVRAVNVNNLRIAKMSRMHNNSNVLCLGQDYLEPGLVKKIIDIWLKTGFRMEEKYQRRVDKIEQIEDER